MPLDLLHPGRLTAGSQITHHPSFQEKENDDLPTKPLPGMTWNPAVNLQVYTPRKINIDPENDGLVQMIFLLPGVKTLRFHVNLPGFIPT